MLNHRQQRAVEVALSGHNLLLLGAAGTGKTWTVQKMVQAMQEQGRRVQVTCSTGIACSVYPSKYRSCTIHKFLGVGDGRYGPCDIVKVIEGSSKYGLVKENLDRIDCLVIDEVSMISAKLFETIAAVCRIKHKKLLFGGLQILFCGDFLQLPPVSNVGDAGRYCFQSPLFHYVFPHVVILNEVTRTSDHQLITVISEVFSGEISAESEDFIASLSRSLPCVPQSECVKLFSKNYLVDDFNRGLMLNFPGNLQEYQADDSGNTGALNSILAPKTLWLKVSCPVVLLQNLSDSLVNGLRGTVYTCDNNCDPVVDFGTAGVITIPKVKFSVFDPVVNKDIASRHQYPLKPAFGLTIHKAQGMTLNRVEVDCKDIFQPGQLGVALSRVQHSKGLRIINYHPRYVIKHPSIITDFLNSAEDLSLTLVGTIPDKKLISLQHKQHICCRKVWDDIQLTIDNPYDETEVCCLDKERHLADTEGAMYFEDSIMDHAQESDIDDIMDALFLQEEEALAFELPETFDITSVVESIRSQEELTQIQRETNVILDRLNVQLVTLFVKKIFLKLIDIISLLNVTDMKKGIPERLLQQFQKSVHNYSISTEYKMNCFQMFENEASFSNPHKIICFNILGAVKLFLLEKKVHLLKDKTGHIFQRHVSEPSRARIRYVAGYCVAKLRRKYAKSQNAHMFGTSRNSKLAYIESKALVTLLDVLKEEEHFLKKVSSEPSSLIDISRRQNVSHSLTNVTDSFFEFFVCLSEVCLSLLTGENFSKFENKLYSVCQSRILENTVLFEQFISLIVTRMKNEKLESFLDETVFRADTQSVVHFVLENVVMQSALISQVFQEIVDKYLHVLFNQFCRDVKSASKLEKQMAHRKQIKVSDSKKRGTVKEFHSSKQLSVGATALAPESLPGPSVIVEDLCKKCKTEFSDMLIQCDNCNSWLHRTCAGLTDNKLWKKFSKQSAKWYCGDCI